MRDLLGFKGLNWGEVPGFYINCAAFIGEGRMLTTGRTAQPCALWVDTVFVFKRSFKYQNFLALSMYVWLEYSARLPAHEGNVFVAIMVQRHNVKALNQAGPPWGVGGINPDIFLIVRGYLPKLDKYGAAVFAKGGM